MKVIRAVIIRSLCDDVLLLRVVEIASSTFRGRILLRVVEMVKKKT